MPRKTNPHSVPFIKPDFHSQNIEKQQQLNEEEAMNLRRTKKHRLRSSLDIYNRLMHDQTLNIDLHRVVIGYSDHILGDQEMCVLDWTMIEKGGDIPMHHILYFSFILNNANKLILWHKKTKLDRLYGSGVTKPNQRINVMLNSKKIKNIQSQKPIKQMNEYKQIDDHPKIIQIPKQIKHKNDMIEQYFPRYPVSNDGFVESFKINETEKWLKYLDFYGCVVLKVLNEDEVNESVNAMFDEIYARTCELNPHKKDIYKIDINNPFTWTEGNWPNPKFKFLTDRPAFCKQAFVNRCSEKMHYIFSQIYKDSKLNVTIDNWGIQRGTKDLKFINPVNGQAMMDENVYNSEQKKWRKNLQPHWDINPWSYSEWIECGHYEYIYQGALALSEQRIEDGTHLTLPCGTRFLAKWCAMHKDENSNPHRHTLSANSNLIKCMQPMPLRKGEMIIWNYGQCHANTKNYSNRMRLCQYIRMFPAKQKYIQRDHYSAQAILKQYKRHIDIRRILGKDLDGRTKKLLGLESW